MKKLILTLIAVIAVMAVGCKPEDPKVEVTGVKLSLTTVELTVEGTQSITASVEPADATDKTLTWSSSDESVAKVDQSGKITAVSPGTATITAKSANGKSVSCTVTVKEKSVPVTAVTLDKNEVTLTEGSDITLVATVSPENATDKTVTWSSDDEAVATVDANGKVTAVATGEATITAKAGDKTATCTITVSIPVTGVLIENGDNHIRASMNSNTVVNVTVSPSNATNKNITWSVDDPTILQLSNMTNSSCSIKGLKEGYVTLKATTQDGNKVDECIISVHNGVLSAYFKSNLDFPTSKISAGSFLMGSPNSSTEVVERDEVPQHSVTLTKAFYMSKFETTNYQFAEFLNAKNVGSDGKLNGNILIVAHSWGVQYNTTTGKWQVAAGKDHYPVVYVTWYGASEFAAWVGGRLPTEAEWEYACRAGTTTPYFWGSTSTGIGNYDWYEDNSDDTTHPVGKKQTNAWGLYDMIGNVWEWCSDLYSSTYYTATAQTDPTGPTSGSYRVLRGSGFGSGAEHSRSANRASNTPTSYNNYNGFRVVFD